VYIAHGLIDLTGRDLRFAKTSTFYFKLAVDKN
jgi:hypothetical protein